MMKKTRLSLAVSAAFGAGLIGIAPQIALAQQQLERVEITGSSLRRVDAETALPITVLRADELIKQGVTTAEQAIQRIAANQSNFGVSQAIGSTTGGKAEADIRGLSAPFGNNANKTLVLLNGRRLANHPLDAAAVDLNAIPFAAIDRIEVLRDGASAIYGTDAIGGVINFILRRDYQGAEASAEWQAPQASGGGETFRANILAGWGSLTKEGWNVMGAVDWRKQNVLEAKDREFARTGILGPTRDDLTNGTSGTSFPGDLNGFEPSGPGCNPPSSLPRFTNPDNSGAFNSCRYDFTRDIDIIPENEQLTFLVRGSFALGKNHTLSGEYLHANNEATSRVAPTPNSYFLPASSPFYPAGQPSALIPGFEAFGPGGIANWRAVPAGKRTSGDDTDNERLMAELTGTFAGSWDYRAALGQAKSKVTTDVSLGYLNEGIMQAGHISGAINPFGPQPAAGTAVINQATVVADTSVGESKVNFVDFRVTKDIFQMAGGPAAMALGAEYRKEESEFVFTDITAELINSLGLDPDADTKGDRNVTALYGEFGFPIIRGLDLTLAARWDHYSDFGNTVNPKIGVRYQPMRQLLLRGSFNTGFRAPTLYEIYAPQALTFTTDNYDDPVLCPGGTAIAGAPPGVVCGQQTLIRGAGPAGIGQPVDSLDPEESKTWTIGFVFEPISNFTFGVDYWDLKVKDLISGLPEQTIFAQADPARFFRCSEIQGASFIPDVCLFYNPAAPLVGGVNPTDVIAFVDSPNENLGELRTSGFDVSARWRSMATPYGTWGVGIDGTYVRKYEYQRTRGGEFVDALGRYSDAAPVFRWQHVLTLDWNTGPWSVVAANRFKSGYTDQGGVDEVGNYSVFDTTLTWTSRNLTLSGGVLNIFDKDPPRTVQSSTFQRGYDPRFTDPRGRTFLLRAGYKFL